MSKPEELIERLRLLADAIKLSPHTEWQLWTSNSWRRFQGVLEPVTQKDGHPDLHAAPGVLEFIEASSPATVTALLDALEAQAREIEGLQAQLDATAKSAFEAMPHDIPQRMKRKICVETGWSMSMVSRAYIELRAAFTGEKYTANEDLDAAHAENELLHKGLRQAELEMHLIAMAIDEGAPERAKRTALLYPMTIGAVTARKLAEDRLINTRP